MRRYVRHSPVSGLLRRCNELFCRLRCLFFRRASVPCVGFRSSFFSVQPKEGKMRPSVALRWVCFLLALGLAGAESTLHKRAGDVVVLQPGTAPVAITSIVWRVGADIAAQFDGTDVDLYRQFRERGSLNVSSGELTITGLTLDDSATYTPEINNVHGSPTRLIVISPVPTPTATISCDDEGTSCELTCDANTEGVGPVTYNWRSGDMVWQNSSRERRVSKEDHGSSEFRCELENLVSRQSSQPIPNPFFAPTGSLRLAAGLGVFAFLLGALLLLVVVHRWKAGMWFFQKESMPWEADFWRNDERRPDVQPGSNGAPLKKGTDEETPMV